MLQYLSGSLADQSPVCLHLSSGLALDGVVMALHADTVELRQADGSRSLVLLAHVIATTVR